MLWDRIPSDPDKAALARALIERVPVWGWGEAALSATMKWWVKFRPIALSVLPPSLLPILTSWALLYTTSDKSLIKALGGEEEAAVSFLAYVHHVMETGDQGPGHTDGRSNFAFVRSPIDQRLWVVHWTVNYASEWVVGAVYVPHPDLDWPSGSRLFSSTHKHESSDLTGVAGR